VVAILCLSGAAQNERFFKYPAVEAYEIRPGMLMMPRYSDGHEVCEIVLERNHYSNETANLDSTMPRDVISQMVDELAPPGERGPIVGNLGNDYISAYTGNAVTTFADYKNVSIHIFGIASTLVVEFRVMWSQSFAGGTGNAINQIHQLSPQFNSTHTFSPVSRSAIFRIDYFLFNIAALQISIFFSFNSHIYSLINITVSL